MSLCVVALTFALLVFSAQAQDENAESDVAVTDNADMQQVVNAVASTVYNLDLDVTSIPSYISALINTTQMLTQGPGSPLIKVQEAAMVYNITWSLLKVLPCIGDGDYLMDLIETKVKREFDKISQVVVDMLAPIRGPLIPIYTFVRPPLRVIEAGLWATVTVGGIVGPVTGVAGNVLGEAVKGASGIAGSVAGVITGIFG